MNFNEAWENMMDGKQCVFNEIRYCIAVELCKWDGQLWIPVNMNKHLFYGEWSLYEPAQTLSDKIITGYPISSDERLTVEDVKEALSRFIDKSNSKTGRHSDFKDSDMFKDLREIFGDRLILK